MAKAASAKTKNAGTKSKAKAAPPSVKKAPTVKTAKPSGNKAVTKASKAKPARGAKATGSKIQAAAGGDKGSKPVLSTSVAKAVTVKADVGTKGVIASEGKAKGASADKAQAKANKKVGASGPAKSSDDAVATSVPNAVIPVPSRLPQETKVAELPAKASSSKENPVPTVMARLPEKKGKGSAGQGSEKTPEKVEKKAKKSKSLNIALDRLSDLGAQWMSLYERSKEMEALPYKMSGNYEAKTAIMHKVLGWGFVLSSQNDRLEVLFKDGIKILIANYKS